MEKVGKPTKKASLVRMRAIIKIHFGFLSIIADLIISILKQLFHIKQEKDNKEKILSLYAGDQHCSFAITDQTGSALYELAYCIKDEQGGIGWSDKELSDFLTTYALIQTSFQSVKVCYQSPQAMISSETRHDESLIQQLVCDITAAGKNDPVFNDNIRKWNLLNYYAIPRELSDMLSQNFPAAKFCHPYSLILNNTARSAGNQQVVIELLKDNFSVIVVNGVDFVLAQNYEYSTPADVLYYLLKICRQFSLSQYEVLLNLSGLIDQKSGLYKELLQYFEQISFRNGDWKFQSGYPLHYFTTLNDLARCEL